MTLEVKRRILKGFMMLALMLTGPATAARAQGRLFPDVPSFELPLASPTVAGFAGRVLQLSRGESQFGKGREADVAVGESFPALALRRGPRPITLGFSVEVYGRFSLDDAKTSMISTDWTVGFDLQADLRPWELALQLYHESSHLGDEYMKRFQASRIDWTREVVMLWGGYRPGRFRILAGLGVVPQDELDLSPWLAGAGVDYRGGETTLLGLRLAPLAGVYADGASATDWRTSVTGKVGVVLRGSHPGRELTLSLLAHDGLSRQRQFFRNTSRYIGMELGFQL